MDIIYRQVRKEDGYEWYSLLDNVWRVAYDGIIATEVFDARDNAREDRARGFTEEKFIGDRKIAYVAESDGKIVGLMFGTLDSDYEFFKNDYADRMVIGVLKDNAKARKVYESWGGKLSEHKHDFVQMNVAYPEVFYTFELN